MQYEVSAEVEKVAKGVIKDHLTDLRLQRGRVARFMVVQGRIHAT